MQQSGLPTGLILRISSVRRITDAIGCLTDIANHRNQVDRPRFRVLSHQVTFEYLLSGVNKRHSRLFAHRGKAQKVDARGTFQIDFTPSYFCAFTAWYK